MLDQNLLKKIQISHNNTNYSLWYNLYRIDKIIFADDPFHKTIDILEELLDNNNYVEYTECDLSNSVSSTSINYPEFDNFIDFQNYILEESNDLCLCYYYDEKHYLSLHIKGLKDNIISQPEDIEFLNNRSTSHHKDITILKDTITDHQVDIKYLKDNIKSQKEEINILKSNNSIHIKKKNNTYILNLIYVYGVTLCSYIVINKNNIPKY